MIMIYNFLSDSIKYQRYNDVGYLIARIFINKDGHFFTQGRNQFDFLFNDFENNTITGEVLDKIIETAIIQSVDFDLFVPPFDAIKEISLSQKVLESGTTAIKTGKRVGYIMGSADINSDLSV
jgi:hypothetical protein